MKFDEFGRRAMDHLHIPWHRRSPSQSTSGSRAPSAEPQGKVHPQGISTVGPPSSKAHPQSAPPWQGWEPDSTFLYELHKWNLAHKDDKLPVVLAKVNKVLESNPLQSALEIIPDNPFPAKSLVKAIISLFLLGSVSDISLLADPASYTQHIIYPENPSGEARHL